MEVTEQKELLKNLANKGFWVSANGKQLINIKDMTATQLSKLCNSLHEAIEKKSDDPIRLDYYDDLLLPVSVELLAREKKKKYLKKQSNLEQEREEKTVNKQSNQNNKNNPNNQDLEIIVMDVKNQDEVNKEIYNLLHGKLQAEKDYDVKGKAREIIKNKEAPMMPKLMAHLLIKSFEEEFGKDEKQFENDKKD